MHIGPNKGKPPVLKGPCWFCLGSPEVDKHLVVSVGEQVSTNLSSIKVKQDLCNVIKSIKLVDII